MMTNRFIAKSGDWNTASNWSKGVVPGTKGDYADDVVIPGPSGQGGKTITLTDRSEPKDGYVVDTLSIGPSAELFMETGKLTLLGASQDIQGLLIVDGNATVTFDSKQPTALVLNTFVGNGGVMRLGADTTFENGGPGVVVVLEGGRIVSLGKDVVWHNLSVVQGVGQIGDGHLQLENGGVIENLRGRGRTILDLCDAQAGVNRNERGATIESSGVSRGRVLIEPGSKGSTSTFVNKGYIEAVDRGVVIMNDGVDFLNIKDGTLTGGAYSATDNATLEFNRSFSTLQARMVLSQGSVIESHDASSGTTSTLQSMLTTIATGGSLQIGKYLFTTASTTFEVQGTMVLKNNGTFDFGAGAGSRLLIQAGGVVDLQNDSAIGSGSGSQGVVSINAGGTLRNTGTDPSVVDAPVFNRGTIAAANGSLEIVGSVQGAGQDTVESGGTLQFDMAVAATQAVAFGNGGGTLHLADAQEFAGSIGAFGRGDTIDVDGLGDGTTYTYKENAQGTGGTLTLKNGSTVDKLTLVGSYQSSGFSLTTGASGDTLVTYAPPNASNATATSHASTLGQSLFEAAFAGGGMATISPMPHFDVAASLTAARDGAALHGRSLAH